MAKGRKHSNPTDLKRSKDLLKKRAEAFFFYYRAKLGKKLKFQIAVDMQVKIRHTSFLFILWTLMYLLKSG